VVRELVIDIDYGTKHDFATATTITRSKFELISMDDRFGASTLNALSKNDLS
jgi:hypothetical protein